jgi:hypothetical protein
MFPKKLDNTTLNSDLHSFFNSDYSSSLITKPIDLELFRAPKKEAFLKMFDYYAPGTFIKERVGADNDYTYVASEETMHSNNAYVFSVSDGELVRILGAEVSCVRDENNNEVYAEPNLINEYILPGKELNKYINQLKIEYIRLCKKHLSV